MASLSARLHHHTYRGSEERSRYEVDIFLFQKLSS